ncbi:hypothetical protein BDY21DRAFT_357700 [Lineolata rhizophorae]|uniref:mRNA N(6)-methyladenine demethylase n=1 Tax=Lineolata rhizophorae TaxID=578093 RepID=A0A6A6NN06_9PEZI|nr:hypothetical protein BDY21DRAFT_357700 [Lineolata rhizophorae]
MGGPGLDPHRPPPDRIRSIWKRYRHMQASTLDADPDVLDFSRGLSPGQRGQVREFPFYAPAELERIFARFADGRDPAPGSSSSPSAMPKEPPSMAYEHRNLQGLVIIPSLLPPHVQLALLSRLFHRDLSNSRHMTNVHLHHHVVYPPSTSHSHRKSPASTPPSANPANGSAPTQVSPSPSATPTPPSPSFFSLPVTTTTPFPPLNPSTHRPLPLSSFLSRKLRWLTLGAQYDWTAKSYPAPTASTSDADNSGDGSPSTAAFDASPAFPADIAALLRGLFPQTEPQAAIVNVYAPGDVLGAHRDVSEESARGLVSVSVGCDGVFVIGHAGEGGDDRRENEKEEEKEDVVVVRLRSGDVVYMDGRARFAWHGVPAVLAGTCPAKLREWPAGGGGRVDGEDEAFEAWRGWMAGKRVNLNVRQMWD